MSTNVGNLGELGINIQQIYTALFADKDLCKLIYYKDADPLSHADVATPETTLKDYIKFVPRIGSNETTETKVVFVINGGKKLDVNTNYQNVSMSISVYTPFTSWFIKDSNFRIFAILSRIITLLDGKTINGLGKMVCGDFDLSLITEEVASYTLAVNITLSA